MQYCTLFQVSPYWEELRIAVASTEKCGRYHGKRGIFHKPYFREV